MIERIVLIVIDSVGIGYLPDANKYGDMEADTLGNILKTYPDLSLPNMGTLGLYDIDQTSFESKGQYKLIGSYGKMKEVSVGKDTSTGHWEIAGLYTSTPFNTYPKGFPEEIMNEFEKQIGRKTLGNKVASGTVILDELGEEHMRTGSPIVYTSADSVFQIATHEYVIPLEELYHICKIARNILTGEHQVTRVIARPFIGKLGAFERTSNRHDFSVSPGGITILDMLKDKGLDVVSIGKISDIFNGCGITQNIHIVSNMDGVDKTLQSIKEENKGLIFTNLVDFDAKYGHRRDVNGYANALKDFDLRVPEIINALKDNDMLIITADHGNDPTFKGTDHTREYVPLLVYGKNMKSGVNLGERKTFADVGQTIAQVFGIEELENGTSFLKDIVL